MHKENYLHILQFFSRAGLQGRSKCVLKITKINDSSDILIILNIRHGLIYIFNNFKSDEPRALRKQKSILYLYEFLRTFGLKKIILKFDLSSSLMYNSSLDVQLHIACPPNYL
jgi:hypothetical protein